MIDKRNMVHISSESDIVAVRKIVREITTKMGFNITDVTRIVTAASELARNIFLCAKTGVMLWQILYQDDRVGIELKFEDHGPGIPDIQQAMQEGYSTVGGLGMGLPGTKRLMDEMKLESEIGKGTIVTVRKWRKK